jgi:hypothetical protein
MSDDFVVKTFVEEYSSYKGIVVPPLSDLRNVARLLRVLSRPAPTPNEAATRAPECPTLEECFRKHGNVPFVVRNVREILDLPGNDLHRDVLPRFARMNSSIEFVEGFDALNGDLFQVPPQVAVDMLLHRNGSNGAATLHTNIIDGAGVDGWWVPPKIMHEYARYEMRDKLPMLSPSGSYTPQHSDPADQGTTYIFSFTGYKRGEFLAPVPAKDLMRCDDGNFSANPSTKREPGSGGPCPITSWQARENLGCSRSNTSEYCVKTLQVWYAEIGPGDFFCWPPGWLHWIWTDEPFLGANGYINLTAANVEAVAAARAAAAAAEVAAPVADAGVKAGTDL